MTRPSDAELVKLLRELAKDAEVCIPKHSRAQLARIGQAHAAADALEAAEQQEPTPTDVDRLVAFMCERERIPLEALSEDQQKGLRDEATDLIRVVRSSGTPTGEMVERAAARIYESMFFPGSAPDFYTAADVAANDPDSTTAGTVATARQYAAAALRAAGVEGA